MPKTESTVKTITVRHLAQPMGQARENGPHLKDLRDFVAECEGLPDDLLVRIDKGHLDEGGRQTTTLSVAHRIAVEPED